MFNIKNVINANEKTDFMLNFEKKTDSIIKAENKNNSYGTRCKN